MSTPYFLWDYDLSDKKIKQVLHGSNQVEKRWLAARILTHAKFEDVWQYLNVKDIINVFPYLKLPKRTKKAWQRALTVWGYNEIFLENKKEGWQQKIDIVQEQPIHFGDFSHIDTVVVDSLINIATNKLLAVYGRLEAKDYIDLYVIFSQTDFSFEEIFALAKKKDSGLSEFYFANAIADADQFEVLPKMKIPFNKKRFQKFYKELSERMLLKIKPSE